MPDCRELGKGGKTKNISNSFVRSWSKSSAILSLFDSFTLFWSLQLPFNDTLPFGSPSSLTFNMFQQQQQWQSSSIFVFYSSIIFTPFWSPLSPWNKCKELWLSFRKQQADSLFYSCSLFTVIQVNTPTQTLQITIQNTLPHASETPSERQRKQHNLWIQFTFEPIKQCFYFDLLCNRACFLEAFVE